MRIDRRTYNRSYIFRMSIVSALGGLLFGFDTAIISGTIGFVGRYFHLTGYARGWAVSVILIGCAIGAIVAGRLSDDWGRRRTLLFSAVLFIYSGIGTGLADTFGIFVLCRLAGGVAVGVAAMAAPMYIAEMAPSSLRGRLVSLYQLAIVTGVLLAYLSNYLLAGIGENNWRWMFASQGVPSLVFFVCLLLVPETPCWLIRNGRKEDAAAILEKVGGRAYSREEIAAIERSFGREVKDRLADLLMPAFGPVLRMGVTIAVFQQITGINAILYYAPEIFRYTGVSDENALLQSIGIGAVNFLFTLVAIWLVDKAG